MHKQSIWTDPFVIIFYCVFNYIMIFKIQVCAYHLFFKQYDEQMFQFAIPRLAGQGPFFVEFACSLCISIGLLWVLWVFFHSPKS